MLVRMWRKGNPWTLLVENVNWCSCSMEVSEETQDRTTLGPSDSTSGCISGVGWGDRNMYSKRYMHPKVQWSTIYHCQDMEATWVSTNRWMDKEVNTYKYTHTHTHTYTYTKEYYCARKRMKFCHLQQDWWT